MAHPDHLLLLDREGQPLDPRIARVLTRLLPRLRRHFPGLSDDTTITDMLERAGRRIARREQRAGPIEQLHSYAWVTLRSVATSDMRRGAARLMQGALASKTRHTRLASAPAVRGTAQEIERNLLLKELLGQLSPEERLVCLGKKAGFSSQEIAKYLKRSATAVNTLFSRAKQKLRRALNPGEDHRGGDQSCG